MTTNEKNHKPQPLGKWIGYSKNVAYPVLRLGKSKNTGWCIIEGYNTPVCCSFDKIVRVDTDNQI